MSTVRVSPHVPPKGIPCSPPSTVSPRMLRRSPGPVANVTKSSDVPPPLVLSPQPTTKKLISIHDLQEFVPSPYVINDFIHQNAEEFPDKIVYTWVDGNGKEAGTLTNHELRLGAYKVAIELMKTGVKKGDRVVLVYPPCIDFITAFYGCILIGTIAVPVFPPDPRNAKKLDTFKHITANCGAQVALTVQMYRTAQRFARGDWPNLKWIATDKLKTTLTPEAIESVKEVQVSISDIAFLQYTSGSTSQPKGVMLTHGNLVYDIFLLAKDSGLTVDEVAVNWIPQYHDFGLIGGIIGPVLVGCSGVLMSPLDFIKKPVSYLHAITKYKGTIIAGPNFSYELLVKRTTEEDLKTINLSSVKVAANGAEPVRSLTVRNFINKFSPVGFKSCAYKPMYGLAEHCVFVSAHPEIERKIIVSFNQEKLRADKVAEVDTTDATGELVGCGMPLGIDIRIVDPDTMTECAPDRVGEVWLTSPGLGKGYWELDDVTTATFKGSCTLATGEVTPAHYFRTGDFGFIHEGCLFINGRLKDLIIIRGKNIFPQDIELLAEQSHDKVKPGCIGAFATEIANEEHIVVVAEVREGVHKSQLGEIAQHIKSSVSSGLSVTVRDVVLIPARTIAKTSSGKIQRQQCKAFYTQNKLKVLFSLKGASGDDESSDEGEGATDTSLLPASHLLSHMQLLPSDYRMELLTWFLKQEVKKQLNIRSPVKDFETANLIEMGMDSIAAAAIWEKIAQIQDSAPIAPTLLYDNQDIKSIVGVLTPTLEEIFKTSKTLPLPNSEAEAKKFLTCYCMMSMKLAADGHLWEDMPQDFNVKLTHADTTLLSSNVGRSFDIDTSDFSKKFSEDTESKLETVVDQFYGMLSSAKPVEVSSGESAMPSWGFSTPKQVLCGAAQVVSMALYLAFSIALCCGPLYLIQKFAGEFSFTSFTFSAQTGLNRYAVGALFLPVLAIMYFAQLFVALPLLKWLVIGKYKEGSYPVYGSYYMRWWFIHTILGEFNFFYWLIAASPLMTLWYRLLGAKVGSRVLIATSEIREFDLVEIGDGAILEGGCRPITHRFAEGMLILERVTIGNHCILGPFSLVDETLPAGKIIPANTYSRNIKEVAAITNKPVPPVSFIAFQFFNLILLAFVAGICTLPFMAYLNLTANQAASYYAPLSSLFVAYGLFALTLSTLTLALKWGLIGRIKADTPYPAFGAFAMKKMFVEKVLGLTFQLVLYNLMTTYLFNWYYKLMGLKIGSNVVNSRMLWGVEDSDLLEIGNNVFIGGLPRFSYSKKVRNEKGEWVTIFEKTKICDNCWIGGNNAIARGITIGKGSVVADYSNVTESIPEGSFALGVPTATVFKKAQKQGIQAGEVKISYFHKMLRLVLEVATHIVLNTIKFASMVPGYYLLQVIIEKLGNNFYANVAGFVVMFTFGSFYTFVLAISVDNVCSSILTGKKRKAPIYSALTFLRTVTFANNLVYIWPIMWWLRGTPLMNVVLRILGAKIGKDVFNFAPKITTEYSLLRIGDRTVINDDCFMYSHSFKNFEYKQHPTTIGADCNLGSWSTFNFTPSVGDRVVFTPGTKPMPGTRLKANRYTNNPAQVCKENSSTPPASPSIISSPVKSRLMSITLKGSIGLNQSQG